MPAQNLQNLESNKKMILDSYNKKVEEASQSQTKEAKIILKIAEAFEEASKQDS